MSGVELGRRYRAGAEGARITFEDGRVLQLLPYGSFTFKAQPKKIEGKLTRVRRGRPVHEVKA